MKTFILTSLLSIFTLTANQEIPDTLEEKEATNERRDNQDTGSNSSDTSSDNPDDLSNQDDSVDNTTATTKFCDIYISSSDNSDILALDQFGKYIRKARRITLMFPINVAKPTALIESWDGAYRPRNAEMIKHIEWPVRTLKFVSDEEFRQIVDLISPLPPSGANSQDSNAVEEKDNEEEPQEEQDTDASLQSQPSIIEEVQRASSPTNPANQPKRKRSNASASQ